MKKINFKIKEAADFYNLLLLLTYIIIYVILIHGGDKMFKELKEININEAFNFVTDKLFKEKTNLIYDRTVADINDFPTADEIKTGFPNPCGYGTNMEDSMICAGTMLDTLLCRIEIENDEKSKQFAHKIVSGMINCAKSAKSRGFLPRSVTPYDAESHYNDSSRDQYTLFIFGACRYITSSICTEEERIGLKDCLEAMACRAKKNVVAENGYDLLCDDGSKSLNCTMWGDELQNHEIARLPALYLAAYVASGDEKWLNEYLDLRESAFKKSLPMTNYWHLYSLHQMQTSLYICSKFDPDKQWREKFHNVMLEAAKYTAKKASNVLEKLEKCNNFNSIYVPFREAEKIIDKRFSENVCRYKLDFPDENDYFTLQDCADIAIVTALADYKLDNIDAFIKGYHKIDFSLHSRNTPVYFLNGYYRLLLLEKDTKNC